MHYHVGRNSQQLGVFSGDEIRAGLNNGSFYATDLAWNDAMSGWKRLDEVFGPLLKPVDRYAVSIPQPYVQTAHAGNGVMPIPGTSVACLILGIVSLVTCHFGILFAIPGVICGHVALGEIKRSGGRQDGRSLTVVGLVLNYIWLGLVLLLLLIFLVTIGVAFVVGKP